jgi:hypothetical protein
MQELISRYLNRCIITMKALCHHYGCSQKCASALPGIVNMPKGQAWSVECTRLISPTVRYRPVTTIFSSPLRWMEHKYPHRIESSGYILQIKLSCWYRNSLTALLHFKMRPKLVVLVYNAHMKVFGCILCNQTKVKYISTFIQHL